MTKIIYAVGIHSEGGLNILSKFLNKCDKNVIFYLDKRLKVEKKKNFNFINKSSFSRFFHLLKLKYTLNRDDHIFFLNGLPPIFNFKCEVSVAFQNANIFRSFYKINLSKWLFSKDSIRNLIFFFGKKNVDNWFVFSPVALEILKNKINSYINIKIIDVISDFKNKDNLEVSNFEYDFIYPASGLEHKNHKLLFDTLISLSKNNIFPKVLITLEDKFLEKLQFKKIKKQYNLKIDNYFEKNQVKFLNIYKKCKCLLYLSKNETIGLPILEANKYGLFIITPNLDYSSQFIKPDYVFDINSKYELESIIKKFLDQKNIIKKNTNNYKVTNNSLNFDLFLNKIL